MSAIFQIASISFTDTHKRNHGYHADNEEMNAFFLALGPSIRPSQVHKMGPFPNLEVHSLVMDMLKVRQENRVETNVSQSLFHYRGWNLMPTTSRRERCTSGIDT